jgi:site-specific DNA recombinase
MNARHVRIRVSYRYRNKNVEAGVDVHGRPIRSHVVREIVPEEAAVVRRIFELYAAGSGLKAIAKLLTQDKAVEPKSPSRHDGLSVPGWPPSTVRTVLQRQLYRGIVVWNQTKKRDDWGKVKQHSRVASDHISVEVPELRIIPEDLWTRIASRRVDTEGKTLRFESGRISGRPPKHATKNLLAGLATCGECGGGLVVETSSRKAGRVSEYVCHRHRQNGSCSNALRIGIEQVNETILQAVEAHALTPEAVEKVIALTERDDLRDRQEALIRECDDLEKRVRRLVEVIANGNADATPLVARMREWEARRAAIASEIAALQPVPRLPASVVESRLAEWRRLLRQSVTQARAVLQRVLDGRITFLPDGDGYRFSARTRFDRLFAGIVAPRPSFVPNSTEGTEHIGSADTHDLDYRLLLERAYGKGLASPSIPSWNQIERFLRDMAQLRQ